MNQNNIIDEFRGLIEQYVFTEHTSMEDLTRWLTTTIAEAKEAGAREERERIFSKLGFMRQWLNEDRISDPLDMVTTKELRHWLEPSPAEGGPNTTTVKE